jgi:hypothetical protein
MNRMRDRAGVLRLPTVVPGGRAWLVVNHLLSFILSRYLLVLLAALVAISVGIPRESWAAPLQGLSLFWALGAIFTVCWFVLG